MIKLLYFKKGLTHPRSFILALFFSFVSSLFSIFHYSEIFYGNKLTWIAWVLAIIFLIHSFFPKEFSFRSFCLSINKKVALLLLFVIILYFSTYLWNFSTAPWNQNGLFDDAAWDIYFAKNHGVIET